MRSVAYIILLWPFCVCANGFHITHKMIEIQCKHESGMHVDAVSDKGAMGLCQIMPDTWDEIAEKHADLCLNNPFDGVQSMIAAHVYMLDLYSRFDFISNFKDRYKLTLASYNAGYTNIMKAREHAKESDTYDSIIHELAHVTGNHNAHLTQNYVEKVWADLIRNCDA